jgi:hypothetical protein
MKYDFIAMKQDAQARIDKEVSPSTDKVNNEIQFRDPILDSNISAVKCVLPSPGESMDSRCSLQLSSNRFSRRFKRQSPCWNTVRRRDDIKQWWRILAIL